MIQPKRRYIGGKSFSGLFDKDRLATLSPEKNEYWGPISVYKAMKKDSKTGSCCLSIPIHKCLVFIVVPPEKPRIYTVDDSQEVRLKLGPYNIGDTVRLRCVSLGGHPQPKVTWWRDHALLDSSDSNQVSFKTENELILKDLQRDDLHSILTCQASNNNISVPVSTSVKLDMNCKYNTLKYLITVQDL